MRIFKDDILGIWYNWRVIFRVICFIYGFFGIVYLKYFILEIFGGVMFEKYLCINYTLLFLK